MGRYAETYIEHCGECGECRIGPRYIKDGWHVNPIICGINGKEIATPKDGDIDPGTYAMELAHVPDWCPLQ